jgi:hypothetical protein
VFSASPEIHRNNFVGNTVNLAILPEWNRPESDTLDATYNWWGIANELAIRSRIRYLRNGDTMSEKVIDIIPFAEQRFEHER